MPTAATLRFEIESSLERRFPSALTPKPQGTYEVAACGIPAVDALLEGGLPVGAISEVTGPESSGRTSLALSFLAQRTRQGQVCAWVDVSDALDPESAAAGGVCLRQLLWVRCNGTEKIANPKPWARLDQALKAVDLILQAAGFAAIVLDLGSLAPEHACRIPLATWFRFRQAAERARTSLLVLGHMAYAQSSAALVLECQRLGGAAADQTVLSSFCFEVRRQRQRSPQVLSISRKPPASTWSATGSWDAARRA
jgi:recombination protein RecA